MLFLDTSASPLQHDDTFVFFASLTVRITSCLAVDRESADGGQPHLINIQFHKKMTVVEVAFYLDFNLDEASLLFFAAANTQRFSRQKHNLHIISRIWWERMVVLYTCKADSMWRGARTWDDARTGKTRTNTTQSTTLDKVGIASGPSRYLCPAGIFSYRRFLRGCVQRSRPSLVLVLFRVFFCLVA